MSIKKSEINMTSDDYYKIDYNFKELRLKYGLGKEKQFSLEWTYNYETRYGVLIKENGYEIDYYVPRLHLNVDVKWKTTENSEEILRTKEVWINKKAVDTLQRYQCRNMDYHYIFAVHIDHLGWMAIYAKDIPTWKVILFDKINTQVCGSGSPMYVVPLRIFKPLDVFLDDGFWR